MVKDWEKFIESREPDIKTVDEKGKNHTKRGHSTWKQELAQLNDYLVLLDLFEWLSEEFKNDIHKYFTKNNKTAGRRSRNFAQKIRDTMGQIRIVITNKNK